jgi:sn-glycerol 3-phosphate transport system permease protein
MRLFVPRQVRDHLVLCLGAVLMGLPLYMVFVAATHGGGLGARDGSLLVPGRALAENLAALADMEGTSGRGPTLARMFRASLVAGVGVAVLTTAVSFLAAYAMSFFRLAGQKLWFGVTLLTLYYPIEARMLPTFDIAVGLGLLNTGAGLILPILPLALATFVFRQHMRTFPPEYMEAARLDGAGPIVFLRDFVLPLSLIPIGAVLVITFVFGWNQYLWPLMISIDNSQFTLMRGLGLVGAGSGPGMALAAISVLPPLVLVVAFLRLMSAFAVPRI